MNKILIKTLAFGLVIVGIHFLIYDLLLPEKWQVSHVFWLDPMMLLMSVGIIYAVLVTRKKNKNNTALTYAFTGMARLLLIAITILILSKQVETSQKMTLAIQIILPAMVFLIYEVLVVSRLLSADKKV